MIDRWLIMIVVLVVIAVAGRAAVVWLALH
jgi:hypothetical protein